MARIHKIQGSRPCLLPPIPFRIPPAKKSEWKCAAGAEGGNARYSARGVGFIPPARIVRERQKQPRARSARHHFVMLVKWVRAKASSSPQIETSSSERAAPRSGAAERGGADGKNARRAATNSDGAGAAKCGDLSLVSNAKIYLYVGQTKIFSIRA